MDILQRLPIDEWTVLKDSLKRDWPKFAYYYNFVHNSIKWKRKDHTIKIEFYCPEAKADAGVFVSKSNHGRIYIMLFSFDDTRDLFQKVLRETNQINWNEKCVFYCVHDNINKMLEKFFAEKKEAKNIADYEQNVNLSFLKPKEECLKIKVNVPEDCELKHIDESYIPLIHSLWPHRDHDYPEQSLEFLTTIGQLNGGYGLFSKKDNSIATWILQCNLGGLGMLQTLDGHKRKGYGIVVSLALMKYIAENEDIDLTTFIVDHNVASQKLFKSLGFRHVSSAASYYMNPKTISNCFGQLDCYSLMFGLPACLAMSPLVTFLITSKHFTIRLPENNVIAKVVQCICHALSKKVKSKEKNKDWLDYAKDKYEAQFIEDIKQIFQIFTLYLPFTIFTALLAAEATTMTFQASRMNGEVAGYLIKPDQIHIIEPLFAIFALPTLHYYIYPCLAKFLRINTRLKKMTMGLSLAALSYYASSIVEFNLEATYAPTPAKNNAHLRIYNALDCKTMMTIDNQNITIDKLDMWENLHITMTGKKVFNYSADFEECRWQQFPSKISGSFEVLEEQAISLVLTKDGLSHQFIDHNNKSLSGNALARALIYMSPDVVVNDVILNIAMNGQVLHRIPINPDITKSEFLELAHGTYSLYFNDQLIQSDVPLKLGGVYTILGYVSNSSKVARVVTVTPSNSMHILWVLPQMILFCAGQMIIESVAIEFMYAESAKSMKGLTLSYWVLMSAAGHATVIIVTEAHFFDRKVFVFLLYAVAMTIGTIIFALLARSYKYRPNVNDNTEQDIMESDVT